jgi:membrane fusion protein (multidrug efflux system)
MRTYFNTAILLCCLAYAPLASAQQSAVSVGTVAAELRPITQATEFVGRIEAPEKVDIRARITGFLQEILFKEGDVVKAGDLLYRIEPETFQAAVQQAQGDLLQAQGNLANANSQLARTQELVKTNTESQALLDQRTAAQKTAQGAMIKADADLKTANVNLSYTEIKAPISGEIGLSKLTKGNVVSPDSGVLTQIFSRDPMYVTFPVSQRILLRVREEAERRQRREALAVRIRFSDGSVYNQSGKINFVNVSVDQATDTVVMRATLPNPQGVLIDGQLVRVSVEADQPVEKVVVPQTALIADQQGLYVFVVEDGKAAIRRVKPGGETGPYAIIDEGVKPGEQVIVQGMETLRAGTTVLATPVPPPAAGG